MVTTAEIIEKNKEYTLASWTAQNAWHPITMDHAEGVYFWIPTASATLTGHRSL